MSLDKSKFAELLHGPPCYVDEHRLVSSVHGSRRPYRVSEILSGEGLPFSLELS